MRLIGIRERLVNEKRIRPEDMHIMANIFLPSNEFNNIERISHLVLTRTGLYIIDSQLLKVMCIMVLVVLSSKSYQQCLKYSKHLI